MFSSAILIKISKCKYCNTRSKLTISRGGREQSYALHDHIEPLHPHPRTWSTRVVAQKQDSTISLSSIALSDCGVPVRQLTDDSSNPSFQSKKKSFSSLIKSRVGNIIAKASALRVNLNLDGAPIAKRDWKEGMEKVFSSLIKSRLEIS